MALDFTPEQYASLWEAESATRSVMDTRKNYIDGTHAITTTTEKYADGSTKSQIVTNYPRIIVERFVGALTKVPWKLSAYDDVDKGGDEEAEAGEVVTEDEAPSPADTEAGIEAYRQISDDQALDATNAEVLEDALIYGYGVEVHTFDKDTGSIEITPYDPREWVFVQDSQGYPQAAIRTVTLEEGEIHDGGILDDDLKLMTVYTDESYQTWEWVEESVGGKATHEWKAVDKEPIKHYYKRIPVVQWRVTREMKSIITDALISQVDEWNSIDSMSGDDIRQCVNAILKIIGMDVSQVQAQAETILKQRIFAAIDKDSTAEYIARPIDTRAEPRLERTRQAIHLMGNIPDVAQIVGTTGATSGIALKLMFTPMEEATTRMITYLKQGVKERVDLINAVQRIRKQPEVVNYNVTVEFDIPVNRIEEWANAAALKDIVPLRMILEWMTDVDDPKRAYDMLLDEREDTQTPEWDKPADEQNAAIDARAASGASGASIDDLMASMAELMDVFRSSGALQRTIEAKAGAVAKAAAN